VLTRKEGKDSLTLRLERNAESADGNDAALAGAVGAELHKKLMARVEMEIVDPGVLPRSFGKSKRVVDLRDQE
jgi:phenylacetate-CoA ligase